MYTETVTCRICGKITTQINHAHLKKHSLTSQQYREMFPDAKMRVSSERSKKVAREKFTEMNKSEDFDKLFARGIFGIGNIAEAKRYLMYATQDEEGYAEKVRMVCDVFREMLPQFEDLRIRTQQFIDQWPDDEVAQVEYEGKKYAKGILTKIEYWTNALQNDINNFGAV